jgi:uncharacterized protein
LKNKLLRYILPLFSFLGLVAPVVSKAQAPAAVATQSPRDETARTLNEKSLLWEVSGKNLKTVSYVFGTIHIIPKDDFSLSAAARAALEKTKGITFEIDMKEMNNPFAILGLMGKMMMKDREKLSGLLSPEDYAVVKHHFDSIKMPLQMLERMKPMFLSVLVDADGAQLQGENANMVSYEMELMKIAEGKNIESAGLETVEFQMSMFDSIPYKAQAEMLVKSVKSKSEKADDGFQELVKIYKSEDIEGMASSISDPGQSELSGFETLILTNRNKSWIPIMQKMMTAKPTFFAVGAAHLGGKTGVLELLRREGYTVKAVKQ